MAIIYTLKMFKIQFGNQVQYIKAKLPNKIAELYMICILQFGYMRKL